MALLKIFRSVFAVILICVIALNGFTGSAFADNSAKVDSFTNGFFSFLGLAVATVTVCYTVDVLIAPVAPPVALYLAPLCPVIGATVGGATTVAVNAAK
jgi:hypothetical protein